MTQAPPPPPLLTPAEVARMFRVDPRTVTRWAKSGRLRFIRTLGGARRYYRAQAEALQRGEDLGEAALDAIVAAAFG
jgi:excisionase family DNA binding protein